MADVEQDLDVNDASNYRCILAKNGTSQYWFGKERVQKGKIPKGILAGLICAQKGEALVSERAQAFQKLTTGLPGLQKKAARLERKLETAEAKKVGNAAKSSSPPRKSPPRSPSAKGPTPPQRKESVKRSPGRKSLPKRGLPPVPPMTQEEVRWLRYYWQATRPSGTELARLVASFRATYGMDPAIPL
jgi:hypothetical protein